MSGNDDRLSDGTIVGTPAFISPERFRGLPAAPSTDMYALGVLLYLCLAGWLPFAPRPLPGRRIAPPPLEPPDLPPIPDLPAEVADVCLSCLDPDPERRPSSFAAALLLGEAVDARVHLPPLVSRPPVETVSPWTPAAAEAPTGPADADVAGRHRA